jgi:hypothetical protein
MPRLTFQRPEALSSAQSMHQTQIFIVLDTGQIEPVLHSQYLKLLRGELALPEYANQTVRIADWYVVVEAGRPVSLHNETYSLLHFDENGRVRWPQERHGERANRAFYNALMSSTYSDPDDDPAVQRLRRELHSEYAWRPSDEELKTLHILGFASAPRRS